MTSLKNSKTVNNIVFVRADRDKKRYRQVGDVKIWIDTDFRPTQSENCCHDGVVVLAPSKLREGKKVEIQNGDRVYGSHFLTCEEYEDYTFGELLYRVFYEDTLYCKVNPDGSIKMLSDWNFLEPILEPEENLYSPSGLQIKPERDKLKNMGIIRHLSDSLKELGVSQGDVCYFTDSSDYEIEVEGSVYYRMKTEDIIGIQKN